MSTTMEQVKERPLLFSSPMIQALLAGRKTVTRRIVKPQPGQDIDPARLRACRPMIRGKYRYMGNPDLIPPCEISIRPFAFVGQRMWVKEAFRPTFHPELFDCIEYRSDGAFRKPTGLTNEQGYRFSESCGDGPGRWCSSLFMPRWASRITLEVTAVRIEPVQDLTEEEAELEGFERPVIGCAMDEFFRLWERINGEGSWASNPWVHRVAFNLVGAP